jgi:hypothetical protein
MKKKIFLALSFFLVISLISVSAQSSDAKVLSVTTNQSVYEMIDTAFRDKNSDSVSSILASSYAFTKLSLGDCCDHVEPLLK